MEGKAPGPIEGREIDFQGWPRLAGWCSEPCGWSTHCRHARKCGWLQKWCTHIEYKQPNHFQQVVGAWYKWSWWGVGPQCNQKGKKQKCEYFVVCGDSEWMHWHFWRFWARESGSTSKGECYCLSACRDPRLVSCKLKKSVTHRWTFQQDLSHPPSKSASHIILGQGQIKVACKIPAGGWCSLIYQMHMCFLASWCHGDAGSLDCKGLWGWVIAHWWYNLSGMAAICRHVWHTSTWAPNTEQRLAFPVQESNWFEGSTAPWRGCFLLCSDRAFISTRGFLEWHRFWVFCSCHLWHRYVVRGCSEWFKE